MSDYNDLLKNVRLEHKMSRRLVEHKIKEMYAGIRGSHAKITYYAEQLLVSESDQRIEEFQNLLNFETNRINELSNDYKNFKIQHAEYFI